VIERVRKRKNVAHAENRYFSQWKNAINNTEHLRDSQQNAHLYGCVAADRRATEGDNISRMSNEIKLEIKQDIIA